MKKTSLYTLLIYLSLVTVIAGGALQIMHKISPGVFQLCVAFSFILYLLARRLKARTS